MLDRIRIVLVNTSHPGNIGSAARAMKTMGLTHLYLVNPKSFPHPKALEMASGAVDLLAQTTVVASVAEAIADCVLVAGTSARPRKIPWPLLSPHELATTIHQDGQSGPIAILFGRESSGLTNSELERCHIHIQIPANAEYSSLNIAQAVQIIAYELRVAALTKIEVLAQWDYPLATAEQMEGFYVHLQKVLIELQFLKLTAPRKLMTRLRRLFFRARPDSMEMNILRGMLRAVQEAIKKE